MRILAIDTSGQAASVAVAEGGRLLARFWLAHGRTHAEALMPCVEATLGGLGMAPSDIGAVAAVVGPGSFTGLRVGVSCAKAIAYALHIQTIAVPSLDALARSLLPYSQGSFGAGHAGAAGHADAAEHADAADYGGCMVACPMTDARNRQVYSAAYRMGRAQQRSRMAPAMPAAAIAVDELAGRLAGLVGNIAEAGGGKRVAVVFNGDAAERYFPEMAAALPCGAMLADERDMLPDAAAAALVACEMAERGEFTSPADLVPAYLRRTQAERLRDERIREERIREERLRDERIRDERLHAGRLGQ